VEQKPRIVSEDAGGRQALLDLLGAAGTVHVVMESTGHYWRNVFARLVAEGHVVTVVNAVVAARFAQMELRRAKTDSIDALGLARYAAMLRPKPTPVPDEVLGLLRDLGRWRSRCVQDMGDKVRQLHCQMDLAFPEVGRVFRNLGCLEATCILARHPSARALAKARVHNIARLVPKGGRRIRPGIADAIVDLAKNSVGANAEVAAVVVPQLCGDIDRLRVRIAALDVRLESLVSEHELGDLLVSIPGIGFPTAARLLGEIGDPANFKSGKALSAYVGVVPGTSSSGKRKPSSASICRIGNAQLRKALWMPTLAAIKCNPWLRDFYKGLRARGKKPKVAIVATMNKLLRAIWSVAHNRRPFVLPTPQQAT
jgi:transposase